jgi:DNA segregation ATPase FtsK/SpoIIIE, S-DNA-T family
MSSIHSGKNNLEVHLQNKISILREILPSALTILAMLLLMLALISYHPADAGWSNIGKTGGYYNYLSKTGAWFADVLLYIFGRSVWILVSMTLFWAVKLFWFKYNIYVQNSISKLNNISQLNNIELNNTSKDILVQSNQFNKSNLMKWGRSAGFLILWLLVSCTLEALRLNKTELVLPMGAGGIVGLSLGTVIQGLIAERWSVILCAVLWLILAAATLGTSWLAIVDQVGALWDEFQSSQADKQDTKHNVVLGQVLEQQRNAEIAKVNEIFLPTQIHINNTAPAVIPVHIPIKATVIPPIPVVKPPVITVLPDSLSHRKNDEVIRPVATINTFTVVNDASVHPIDTDQVEQSIYDLTMTSNHLLPPLTLLDKPDVVTEFISRETLEYTCRLIEKKLRDYNVIVKVVAAQPGPVITRYEVEPAEGVKGSQIVVLARDLARSLSLTSIRVVETIPGKTTMGLELPNPKRQTVRLSEILGSAEYVTSTAPLTMALGKDITGEPVVMDLAKMPHLLVAGTTGSGKSVGINAMILSLLYKTTAQQVRLILIDPKMLELSVYEGIPHLLAPVVTDMKQASHAVNWCVAEMERRYKLMSRLGVRGIAGFNEKIAAARASGEFIFNPFSLTPEDPEPLKHFTHIVLVVDELADLLMVVGKKIEEPLARLAQKSRACGIHLILATQRPSADVLTGLIRSNVPARIAFQVSSKTDSRIILDQMGADALLGNGDMLYLPKGSIPVRVHGAFVSDEEVVRVANMLRELGAPDYIEGILEGEEEDTNTVESGDSDAEQDALYDKAVEIVLTTKKASISNVQRQLRVGYQRAARMIDAMESAGLISAPEHNGNRTVLAKNRH